MNNTVFNITIIGAGVVGLAVAEELSAQYSDVLVVEKTGPTGCKYERYP
jgi:L-2-hydroxyglutarate oxidase LhgO